MGESIKSFSKEGLKSIIINIESDKKLVKTVFTAKETRKDLEMKVKSLMKEYDYNYYQFSQYCTCNLEFTKFIEKLPKCLHMTTGDFICGDFDKDEWVFKPMSDSGKKDLEYAANIKKLFDEKGIKYKHDSKINPRAFSVNKSEFKKL